MKKILISVMVIGVALSTVACGEYTDSADEQVTKKQEELAQQANGKVGMPNIKNFFEKEIHKEILELRDDPNLMNYAYIQNENGQFTYLGRCVGYPLPRP